MPDWTDHYNRLIVVDNARKLCDELIAKIYRAKMPLHTRWQLSAKEIAFLYRFSLHVGTNLFIERLLRVLSGDTRRYCASAKQNIYFKNTGEAIQNYYYNTSINKSLLARFQNVLFNNPLNEFQHEFSEKIFVLKKRAGLRTVIVSCIKWLHDWFVTKNAPYEIAEYSNWAKQLFSPINLLFFDYKGSSFSADQALREPIRQAALNAFLKEVNSLFPQLDHAKYRALAHLYADFIDHVLPLSIVEGLAERFAYYRSWLKNWQPRRVCAFTGFCYNDNFKTFALLAKRKGASFVGYAHGISNAFANAKVMTNELAFLDYYFAWGKSDSTWLKGGENMNGLKIISAGSTYLSSIKKWKKAPLDPNSLVLLFPSGPLMQFSTDLEEISPENNRGHRLQAISLLKKLWQLYPGLKVKYKPFFGTFANDPVKTRLAKEFAEGRIELINDHPATLYDKVDLVLWDTISTGFAESIQSGVPTLVFHNKFEFDRALPFGKRLNQQLADCGMLFYDVKAGLQMFSHLVNDLPAFLLARKEPISKFQEALAYPISRKEFEQRRAEL